MAWNPEEVRRTYQRDPRTRDTEVVSWRRKMHFIGQQFEEGHFRQNNQLNNYNNYGLNLPLRGWIESALSPSWIPVITIIIPTLQMRKLSLRNKLVKYWVRIQTWPGPLQVSYTWVDRKRWGQGTELWVMELGTPMPILKTRSCNSKYFLSQEYKYFSYDYYLMTKWLRI